MPTRARGTTSRAENIAPMAITNVGVPGEVQMVQGAQDAAEQETMVSRMMALLAVAARISPRRVKSRAITAVANTSKKPSTHRCTSHQRQYSIMA